MSRISLAPLVLAGAATGLLLAGCGGGGGGGSSPAVTQRVSGFSWDADDATPIVGATVKVQGTNISVVTANDGSYTVGPLNPTRAYNLLISKAGYVDTVIKMLTTSSTLQGPQIVLQKLNPSVTVTNTAATTVDSNETLEQRKATVTIPAGALPGGAATAQVGATLLVGITVPGAPETNTQIVYPAVNVNLTGATGDFAQQLQLTFPLIFPMTVGAQIPVAVLGSNGVWATSGNATVDAGGNTATYNFTKPGTYGLLLSVNATAQVVGTPAVTPIAPPYTDPVVVDLTGTTINWSVTNPDPRDLMDSAFIQNQRQGDITVPGDLDAFQFVIHPRGTARIEVVKTDLTVNVTANGFTIQQSTGTGDLDDLPFYRFTPHNQGSGGGN